MPVDSLIQKLWDYGHLQNQGVTASELPLLPLHDSRVAAAVKTFQDVMGAEPTGKMEDAIQQGVFTVERCGCPDYGIEAANGSGSWPVGCWPEYPKNHAFRVKINSSGMPSKVSAQFDAIWDLVVQSYADIGIVFIRDDQAAKYNTLVTFQNLAGSTIGLAIVPQGPRCGDQIWARFDPTYLPGDILNQWARLIAHELGHNMGLSHSRGGIMNPSIVSGKFTRTAWRDDPSFSTLKRWFGGEPVDIGGGPTDPPPPPPTGSDVISGTIVINGKPYVLVPKIEV